MTVEWIVLMFSREAVLGTGKPWRGNRKSDAMRQQLLFTTCARNIIAERLQKVNQNIDRFHKQNPFFFPEVSGFGTVEVQNANKRVFK